jgi:uncharacterized protein (TIGR00255 family)
MTAFAREERQETWGQICWELRSVNHRYLDICVRLPEDLRRLEVTIRERLQQQLKRGKVDCTLYFQANTSNLQQLQLNTNLVQQLWNTIQQINTITTVNTTFNALDILRWPGVTEINSVDIEQVSEAVLHHFEIALTQLISYREREGTQLAALISQRCAAITEEIMQIRRELPLILQNQRERLQTRLTELIELDTERLEQEIVILANKMDVAEELDRLEAHLLEIRQTLTQDQSVGRRLDFLAQELHREANTLSAKSNHIYTSQHALELKVLIEQMREQTQNIE